MYHTNGRSARRSTGFAANLFEINLQARQKRNVIWIRFLFEIHTCFWVLSKTPKFPYVGSLSSSGNCMVKITLFEFGEARLMPIWPFLRPTATRQCMREYGNWSLHCKLTAQQPGTFPLSHSEGQPSILPYMVIIFSPYVGITHRVILRNS